MTTYAAEIEEANDNSVRKARVNALFEGTQMAARMANIGGQISPQAGTARTCSRSLTATVDRHRRPRRSANIK
jgi:hypothetical protein